MLPCKPAFTFTSRNEIPDPLAIMTFNVNHLDMIWNTDVEFSDGTRLQIR